jgi:hypothetical protein
VVARTIVGALLLLVGIVWILQGVDVLGGSFMSGHAVWAVIGLFVGAAGLGLVLGAARSRRAGRR